MLEFYNFPARKLNRIEEDPGTPISELIILRMLYDMREGGNLQTMLFFLDTIFGQSKLLGGADLDQDGGAPIQIFQLPANGSESVD